MPAWSRSHPIQPLTASSLLCSGVPSFICVFLLCICRLILSPGTNGLKIRLILPSPIPLLVRWRAACLTLSLRFSSMPLGKQECRFSCFPQLGEGAPGSQGSPKAQKPSQLEPEHEDVYQLTSAMHSQPFTPNLNPKPAELTEELLLIGCAGL